MSSTKHLPTMMNQPPPPTSNPSEYSKLSKLIKIYALCKTKESSLTPSAKAKLFDDFSRWARNISDRILLAIEMDEVTPDNNFNQKE